MRHASTARRSLLIAVVAGVLMSGGGAAAQAQEVCEGFDCGGGDVVSGPTLQYTFSSFLLCTDCSDGDRGPTTAYIDGVQHPPSPILPPNPAKAFARGKLLVPGATGAERIYAIGRIYDIGGEYLFDGHAVPAAHPPSPINPATSFTFRGIIIVGGRGDPAVS